jgi:hypothetical protein
VHELSEELMNCEECGHPTTSHYDGKCMYEEEQGHQEDLCWCGSSSPLEAVMKKAGLI